MMTPGTRYAALRLARLHPDDRAWLLARLPAEVAEATHALLRMPGAARLAEAARHLEPPACASIAPEPTPVPVTASLALPLQALATLDDDWVSLWLTAHDGDAMERYLVEVDVPRCQRVLTAAAKRPAPLPPRLAATLTRWPHDSGASA
ncbi:MULTISPECIES: hypothetical protein [unclassified Luteibacter]|jgi:hypothetical protein|uniref:hypothetical protein n=1 Tax=Luteibacter sp. PvP019 TaxID=3156436 RepID=UPI00339B5AF5